MRRSTANPVLSVNGRRSLTQINGLLAPIVVGTPCRFARGISKAERVQKLPLIVVEPFHHCVPTQPIVLERRNRCSRRPSSKPSPTCTRPNSANDFSLAPKSTEFIPLTVHILGTCKSSDVAHGHIPFEALSHRNRPSGSDHPSSGPDDNLPQHGTK